MKMSSSNISAPMLVSILQKNYVGGSNYLYFCPHCYDQFRSGSILLQSIIYDKNNETCCWCKSCLNEIHSRTNFSDKKLGNFTELKKLLIQYYHVVDTLR